MIHEHGLVIHAAYFETVCVTTIGQRPYIYDIPLG